MSAKTAIKPGAHGTLYRFAVAYQDDHDTIGDSRGTWKCW